MRHGEPFPCLAPTTTAANSAKTIGGLQIDLTGRVMVAIVTPLKHRTGTAIRLTFDLPATRTSGSLDKLCKAYWILKKRPSPLQEHVAHTFITGELIAEVAVQVASAVGLSSAQQVRDASI